MARKYECEDCGHIESKLKLMKKVCGNILCKKCYAERRKKKRDKLLHEECGVRRRAYI